MGGEGITYSFLGVQADPRCPVVPGRGLRPPPPRGQMTRASPGQLGVNI